MVGVDALGDPSKTWKNHDVKPKYFRASLIEGGGTRSVTEGVRLSLLTEQKRSVIVKIQPKESRFPIVIGIALPMFFA